MAVVSVITHQGAATCIRSRSRLLSEWWLGTGFWGRQPKWTKATSQTSSTTTDAERTSIKADAYARSQKHQARENTAVLKKINFKHSPRADQQHLEIGCGPGGFTRSHVLQHCSPCLRLVAVDKSPAMIDFARKTSQHPRIYYDVLDIEEGDVDSFVNKYGRFNRVYSFLCFHFLKNQRAGYLNIGQLLAEDGECLVTCCLQSAFLDAWLEVCACEKWKEFLPDPMKILPNMRHSGDTMSLSDLESEVRNVVASAGLQCIDCQVHNSEFEFPDADTAADMIIAGFDFEANIPIQDHSEFRKAWREALLKIQTTPSSGYALGFISYAVHATL